MMYLPKNEMKSVELENGTKRTIMAYNDELMLVRFEFKAGQVGALHSHPHTQSTYILSGKFEFEVDGKKFLCNAGDTLIAKSNVVHGCVCLEDGVLIDNFTPKRADFL